ncbi:ROK family protein [Streptomonospora sediminis]
MPRSKAASAAPASSGHVLELIRTGAAATRSDIGRLTGLSRPAVALRIDELRGFGLVTEGAAAPSSGGRPPARLEFNAAGGVVLASALGVSASQAAVYDLGANLLAATSGAPRIEEGPHAAVPWLLETWQHLLEGCGRGAGDVRGSAIGVPGTVEFATGRSETPPVLASWAGIEIAPLVAERFPAPVLLDNDVNLMALGEHRSVHPGAGDLLFVKASTGIGAGVVAGGALLRGALGAAGEIGHIPVRDGAGAACRCGNTGCLEALAGGPALLAEMAERGRAVAGVAELAELARQGDADAVGLVRQAGRRLGEVLAGAVNLLNPEVIVLGGLLGRAHDHLVAGVREVVFRRCTALATRQLRIVAARGGEQSGLGGGAALVLDRILAPEAVNARIAGAGQVLFNRP